MQGKWNSVRRRIEFILLSRTQKYIIALRVDQCCSEPLKQVGTVGGNQHSAENFRWEPEVGTGLRLWILGGNQVGTDVRDLV